MDYDKCPTCDKWWTKCPCCDMSFCDSCGQNENEVEWPEEEE